MSNKNFRERNVEIFEDTARRCHENARLSRSIANSMKLERFTGAGECVDAGNLNVFADPACIRVSKKRTFEAAEAYAGTKVAVLNFASASSPGGGVEEGAGAQEESLCRCSTLFDCLSTKKMAELFYKPHRRNRTPLHNDDCIYTPGVTVFKTDTVFPELRDESEWFDVDVITCAAPNLRYCSRSGDRYVDNFSEITVSDAELKQLHKQRLRRILDLAVMNKVESVVLGAFGCGAFRNDPRIVAEATVETIADYRYAFRNIEFAVYCRPEDDLNYRVFGDALLK
ncbi:TIGR02452 family protein [uncultured Fibrobacter sp.]|jgi:uncharacterized protein (TIGR02452 family)|uniref:TIGR02452 family protein n=1 Tax=uncultured Fibrobacter sp. TaxID=261512 RepID=UPI0026197604|nr:TIGR02452 family protein [uncultured Fibrobacter sp.]